MWRLASFEGDIRLRSHFLSWTNAMRTYYGALHCRKLLPRRFYQLGQLFAGTTAARHEIVNRLFCKPAWGDNEPARIKR